MQTIDVLLTTLFLRWIILRANVTILKRAALWFFVGRALSEKFAYNWFRVFLVEKTRYGVRAFFGMHRGRQIL